MKASSPNEIDGILRDDNSGLRESVVRNLGDFTVALLAIYNGPNERVVLAGTGTLVLIERTLISSSLRGTFGMNFCVRQTRLV